MKNTKPLRNLFLGIYFFSSIPVYTAFTINEQFRYHLVQVFAHWLSKIDNNTFLFIGDSLTSAGRNWSGISGSTIFQHINIAGNGYITWQISTQAKKALDYKPAYCLVTAGTNDVYAISEGFETLTDFKKDYADLLLNFSGNSTKVIITLIPYWSDATKVPLIDSLNRIIKLVAENASIPYIDINPYVSIHGSLKPEMTVDGVHLTPAAYLHWKNEINKVITQQPWPKTSPTDPTSPRAPAP